MGLVITQKLGPKAGQATMDAVDAVDAVDASSLARARPLANANMAIPELKWHTLLAAINLRLGTCDVADA